MVDRLSVLCFAGTYALALISDLGRFVVRSPARWYMTVALMAMGWAVHTAYLGNLALRRGEVPVASDFDSLLVLSWILAAIALYLIVRAPRTAAVGVFVLPVVVALAASAGLARKRTDWIAESWGSWVGFWGTVHGLLLVLGAVFTSVAFVAGLMYLAQARQLKTKRPAPRGFALPSLEQSERINRGAITAAFPLLTFGFFIGVALNLATSRTGAAALRWTDPKVLSTAGLWLLFAALLHAGFRPAMRGRRVMLLTVAAFGFLVFAMVGVDLILPSSHGVPPGPGRGP